MTPPALQDLWGLAEYAPLAARLAPAAEAAVAAVVPRPGEDALDVAAGEGSAARALARAGARVVAVDASPSMVERGRTACAGLGVDWRVGDAGALPVDDGAADVAVSSFGVMYADPGAALAELGRTLRHGGRVAVTAWSAAGFMGEVGRLMASFTGTQVGDLDAWARVDDLADGLGRWCADAGLVAVAVTPASVPWRFDDAAAMTRFLVDHSPAHVAAADAAGVRAPEMFTALERLAAPDGGPVDVAAGYVLITARRGGPS